jgi:uncharacterized protein (DUF924 family)
MQAHGSKFLAHTAIVCRQDHSLSRRFTIAERTDRWQSCLRGGQGGRSPHIKADQLGGDGEMAPNTVLDFWFGADPSTFNEAWFRNNEAFDARCAALFGDTLRAALDGALRVWADTPLGALALVIVLDQLCRNIHRGTDLAFAGDARACRVAGAAIQAGVERLLTPVQRVFLYLPFEHSEVLADQDRSVGLFESLAGTFPDAARVIDYAHSHRDVIRRFGRFPHRNAPLGRTSTPEEAAYLAEPGSGF